MYTTPIPSAPTPTPTPPLPFPKNLGVGICAENDAVLVLAAAKQGKGEPRVPAERPPGGGGLREPDAGGGGRHPSPADLRSPRAWRQACLE